MYDSFDMACRDEDPDLRLNIKVNSENLLPTPQKYNLGSLRLPADPSWPKIPQRRLTDDVGDLIQPPCIVTLTGTPRRSRTTVRIPQSQSCKLGGLKDPGNFGTHNYCAKALNPQSQLPKRRSGCTDPRFKKVTTVKSQMTSTESGEHEIEKRSEINCSLTRECKSVEDKADSWKDTSGAQVIQQKAEKPDETKGTESIGIQTVQTISPEKITFDMNQSKMNSFAESNKQDSGRAECRKKSCSPVKNARAQLKPETPSTRSNLQNRTPRNLEKNLETESKGSPDTIQCCQGKEGQFFLMVEKKVHAKENRPCDNPPDSTSEVKKQCYNVQVPVLSYQNVAVQISTESQSRIDKPPRLSDGPIPNFKSTSLFENIEIPKLELPNDAAPQFLNFGNSQGKPFLSEQMGNLAFQLKLDPSGPQKNLDDLNVQQHMEFQKDRKYLNNDITNPQHEAKFKYISNNQSTILPKSGMNENHRLEMKSSPEKLMKNIHNEEKCRPQQNGMKFFQDSSPKHNFHIYCHQDKPFQRKNLNNQNPSSNDRDEQATRNGNYRCVQQTTDSESVQVTMPSNKQEAGCFDGTHGQDDKDFKCLNHEGTYFEGNESRDWSPLSKYKTVPKYEQGRSSCLRQKRKMKSDQHLMLNRKRVQSSEPQITSRRPSRAPYLKRANSYLSKYTQQLSPDSESTYTYQQQRHRQNENKMEGNDPFQKSQRADYINFVDSKKTGTRVIPHPTDLNDVKREHCVKPYQRPAYKSAKISPSLDLEKQRFSSQKSPRAETDITVEKPTAIPVKTQQLLNKSYWEYYNKLKLHRMENGESPQQQYFCQVAMGAPQSKKRRTPDLIVEESNTSQTGDNVELSLPEIRTLEQCSVLSTMINKTLDTALQPSSETLRTKQIYLNGNMRSSSDPTAGTQSAILKKLFPGDNEDSVVSSTLMYKQKHKRDKHFSNKTMKLKSIGEHPVVFFGCMVYALIVFLPMVYDYFSYEEHDEYENLSYLEIVFEYVIASFKEAFGEFFEMMTKIFFKPDARMQRLSSGRWRQKISKHHLIN